MSLTLIIHPSPLLSLTKILDAVYARGCTFWDTSDAYGDSEVLLGKWYNLTYLMVSVLTLMYQVQKDRQKKCHIPSYKIRTRS
jgi:hypothetical protein